MENNTRTILFVINLMPAMMITLLTGLFLKLLLIFNLSNLFLFIGALYLLPPFLWRFLSLMLPPQIGSCRLDKDTTTVNGWFLSHQLQKTYNAVPMIENLLKLIPGAYSSWLRLWGAEIGTNVKWGFSSAVIDRPFVQIENGCEIKSDETLCAHSIVKKQDYYLLNLKIVIRRFSDSV